MGISRSAFELLCKQYYKRNVGGTRTVIQLGRQRVLFDLHTMTQIIKKWDMPSPNLGSLEPTGVPDDRLLFNALGFDTVDSLDYSDFEGSTFVWDLNTPIPKGMMDSYDLVFDGGTTEHVFNLPIALMNIGSMCKPHGFVIHAVPVNNWPDHGFYMFSPTLLTEYYLENEWRILTNLIFDFGFDENNKWKFYEYERGCLDYISNGGRSGLTGQWIVVQKQSQATSWRVPKQNRYKPLWGERGGDASKVYTDGWLMIINARSILSTIAAAYPWAGRLIRRVVSLLRRLKKPKRVYINP